MTAKVTSDDARSTPNKALEVIRQMFDDDPVAMRALLAVRVRSSSKIGFQDVDKFGSVIIRSFPQISTMTLVNRVLDAYGLPTVEMHYDEDADTLAAEITKFEHIPVGRKFGDSGVPATSSSALCPRCMAKAAKKKVKSSKNCPHCRGFGTEER